MKPITLLNTVTKQSATFYVSDEEYINVKVASKKEHWAFVADVCEIIPEEADDFNSDDLLSKVDDLFTIGFDPIEVILAE